MKLQSINPSTEEIVQEYTGHSKQDCVDRVGLSHQAFQEWRSFSLLEKKKCVQRLIETLKERKGVYAELMALEMGKPMHEGVAEIEKSAKCCEYTVQHVHEWLKEEIISSNGEKSYVSFEPLGAILAIMPWNFPFWQVIRFAVPTLLAGNVVLLKHAPNVSGCSLELEKLFIEAGFPKHVFTSLLIPSSETESSVRELILHPFVAGVTLTGSVRAGKSVAKMAGEALKKCVLELGGNDPYIICSDADLNHAANACLTSRMLNSGQTCIAAKRLIVMEDVKKSFEDLLLEQMERVEMDAPLSSSGKMGPLARTDLRDCLHQQIQESIKEGATLRLGGRLPSGKGAFYPPTLLTDVTPRMRAFKEELFGPVVVVVSAKSEEEAVSLANDSEYGLGGAVFTQDLNKGERMAKDKLQAGSCFVNSFVKSDPRFPFGGIKKSGFGRELTAYGIKEFVNIKTVNVFK